MTATQTHRDVIASVQAAIEQAEAVLPGSLLDDLTDPETGQVTPVFLVSDNGPCFKAAAFARFIASRPELTHIRTRKRSPQTNGVIERYLLEPEITPSNAEPATLPTRQTMRIP